MDSENFRKFGHELIDWMSDYLDSVEKYPVKSQVKPGEIISQIPKNPPQDGEDFKKLFSDFEKIILPGITHWQHPKFFAYFPVNSSRISVLAEMITAAINVQCMSWETSPSATELEEHVMNWLRDIIGLPKNFTGVIQDTVGNGLTCSLLTAREKFTNYEINSRGLQGQPKFIVYCSSEAHSSIEKVVKIIGFGKEQLRKIPVDKNFAMIPEELEKTIKEDIDKGFKPLAVVITIGTTGSTAIDPMESICKVGKKYNLWMHVDAALAGSALVLPEKQWMIKGIEDADTFAFNPHKWLFTNIDCSAYYVKDFESLIKTLEILPEYLKTQTQGVKNYRDWGLQLGRKFRALKLWFVIRNYGVKGLQEKIRYHLELTKKIKDLIESSNEFELLAPVELNTICFRHIPKGMTDEEKINEHNEKLLNILNKTGEVYFTHTKLNGKYTIRFVIGQTEVQERHVIEGWNLIKEKARLMSLN